MKQICNADYWRGLEKLASTEAPCGREFEDVEQSTQCPHNALPPKMTLEELEELVEEADG